MKQALSLGAAGALTGFVAGAPGGLAVAAATGVVGGAIGVILDNIIR